MRVSFIGRLVKPVNSNGAIESYNWSRVTVVDEDRSIHSMLDDS